MMFTITIFLKLSNYCTSMFLIGFQALVLPNDVRSMLDGMS
jgi:hypothetical protein